MHALHLSVHHHPVDRGVELHDVLERIVVFTGLNRYEIGAKSWPNSSERVFLIQGHRRVDRYHFQNFIRRNPRLAALKRAHLGEQAQAVVTSETIGTQANVESQRVQTLERKAAVLEISVATRRMHDVELSL